MRSWQEISRRVLEDLHEAWRTSPLYQREVGELTGMTQSTVSQFLRGRWPDWKISSVVRIASALGYDVEIRLTRRPKPPEG